MSERYHSNYSRRKYLASLGIGHSLEAVHARRAIHQARLRIIENETLDLPGQIGENSIVPINPRRDRSFFPDTFGVLGLLELGDKLGDVLTGLKDRFKKD